MGIMRTGEARPPNRLRIPIHRFRRAATIIALTVLAAFVSTPAIAQGQNTVDPWELKKAMYDLVRTVETARGMDNSASTALLQVDQEIFRGIREKERFLEAVKGVRSLSEVAKERAALPRPPKELKAVTPGVGLLGSTAFFPNYPDPATDVNFAILYPLGLVNYTPGCRVSGPGYDYYVAALAGAKAVLDVSQLLCDAAGCDPTGIGCIIVCGATKSLEAAYDVAAVPVNAANAWQSELDSAENEAAYKNAVLILGDLAAHDDRVVTKLDAQAAVAITMTNFLGAHDAAIKAKLVELAAQLALHDQNSKQMNTDTNAKVDAIQVQVNAIMRILKPTPYR